MVARILPRPSWQLRRFFRRWRDIPVPVVVESASGDFGGRYFHPGQGEVLLDGHLYVPLDRGVIEINITHHEGYASTMAHEWRHHVQMHTGHHDGQSSSWNAGEDYWDAILAYFSGNPLELDALIFEATEEPSPGPLEWIDWIRENDPHLLRDTPFA